MPELEASEDWQGLGKLEMAEADNSTGHAEGKSDSKKPETIGVNLTLGSARNFAAGRPERYLAEGRPD